MSKYLYGASVQGIQDFIFKTNKLQEIVGASETVKGIEEDFRVKVEDLDVKNLLNAAGNIKAIFEDKEELETFLLVFSKTIQQKAYGITLSEAVVEMKDKFKEQDDAIVELERKLKIQRNKPSIPLDLSLNIMELNPGTAKPITSKKKIGKDEIKLDKASEQKRKAFPKEEKFKELKDLSNAKNKIAVIHADGNGLGKLVPKLGDKLSKFSIALNDATIKAFNDAKTEDMKIRDVILGGDDMTVICDANEALSFTEKYLNNFEENTKNIEELKGLTENLTACAGIAYTNEKYPFHYAVNLAEALCAQAKNHSNREASCLMFHNIQSSNFEHWEKFVEEELTIQNESGNIRCDFGPYYLNDNTQPLIVDFMNTLEAYRCDGSPISRLRAWIGELYNSKEYADRMLERINEMADESSNWKSCIMEKNLKKFDKELSNETLIIQKDGVAKTPIYDVLQILSATGAK